MLDRQTLRHHTVQYLGQYVSKKLSFAWVTYTGRVDAHVSQYLAVMWKAGLMEVIQCKLQTLIHGPEMTTKQLPRVHVTKDNTLINN